MKKNAVFCLFLAASSIAHAEYRENVGWQQIRGHGTSEEAACKDALNNFKNQWSGHILDRGCYECKMQPGPGPFYKPNPNDWDCAVDAIRGPEKKNSIKFK